MACRMEAWFVFKIEIEIFEELSYRICDNIGHTGMILLQSLFFLYTSKKLLSENLRSREHVFPQRAYLSLQTEFPVKYS